VRVAVDAMGGDLAPGAIVRGAVLARQHMGSGEVVLVGHRSRVETELAACQGDLTGVRVEHASQAIGMDEEAPVKALRKNPDSSIWVCVRLAVEGQVDAMVSAGNTGAVVAAATMGLRLLPGVKRAGIAVGLPRAEGSTTLIDVGANIKCKPFHLYQYAVMGAVYTQCVLGVEQPRVGLLTVGEEVTKGNDLINHAHRLMRISGLNFVGNVEGRDIHSGLCDLVVCDGFTGNVVLKVCEGLGAGLLKSVLQEVGGTVSEDVGQGDKPEADGRRREARAALDRLVARNDAATYGGAPLLGINGICIICHGRSDERATENAIKLVSTLDAGRVNERIVQDLESRGIKRWSGRWEGPGWKSAGRGT